MTTRQNTTPRHSTVSTDNPAAMVRIIGDVKTRHDYRRRGMEATPPSLALDETLNPETGRPIGEDWLASIHNHSTHSNYRRDLRFFLQWCDQQDVWPITAGRADLDRFIAHDAETHKAATVARRIAALRSFYSYCVDVDLITRSPAARVNLPKVDSHRQNLTPARTAAEMTAVLRAAAPDPLASCLVIILTDTGCRVSEALGLDVGCIEPDGGKWVISLRRKGGAVDRVLATARVVEAVQRLEAQIAETEGRTAGPLLSKNGQRLDRFQAHYIVKKIGREAGLEGTLTPHQFRASGITALLEKGTPLHRVQDWAGHADPVTTQRYNRQRDSLEQSPAPLIMDIFRS